MNPGIRIDYKLLRSINPETARRAVLESQLNASMLLAWRHRHQYLSQHSVNGTRRNSILW
jgi:hypothetical protein